MQVELIETRRLRGERLQKSHWQYWLKIGSNPQVMATMGGIWNQKKAQQKMQYNCEQWELYGHGQWLFFDKATREFVGRGGIRKVTVNDNEEVELGYALMPDFWGQGLAVEIGKKSLLIAFEQFDYSSVVCYTLTGNKRSQKVMQKIGFLFENNILLANQPHVLYRYPNPDYSNA
ncbi:MAG: GNAT family N-acetyltransferase [Pleurocapsa sp. MO_192.B19]|nr:GNAT family N-acetyltransferase [Pleurocapsa sp. MO_192.B19]